METIGDRRGVQPGAVEAGIREPPQRVQHPGGTEVQGPEDAVRPGPRLVVRRVQRPQPLRVEGALGVVAQGRDRVAGAGLAPLTVGEPLVALGVKQGLHNDCLERRGRDSNPRSACTDSGFQDQRIRPLCHPSGGRSDASCERGRTVEGVASSGSRAARLNCESSLERWPSG
jgi:hypothetical protein